MGETYKKFNIIAIRPEMAKGMVKMLVTVLTILQFGYVQGRVCR